MRVIGFFAAAVTILCGWGTGALPAQETVAETGAEEPAGAHALGAKEREALIARHKAKSGVVAVPREELRAAVDRYFGTPPALKKPEPRLEILEKTDAGDHERWRLRYRVEEDELGFAYLLLPKPRPSAGQKRPLIICPHPTSDFGKDRPAGVAPKSSPYPDEAERQRRSQYALDLTRRGFITFAPDRAAYGERKLLPEGNYLAQMAEFRRYLAKRHPGWKLTSGKNVWDLQRGLDALEPFDFIDHAQIGVIGHSLGAWDSIMLLAMDDRIQAGVVNSGGMPAFRAPLWDDPAALRAFLQDGQAQGLTSMTNVFIMLAAPRPLLYLHSLRDPYERGLPNLLEGTRAFSKYYAGVPGARTGPAKADFSLLVHPYGHAFPPEARELAYKFMEVRLGVAQ